MIEEITIKEYRLYNSDGSEFITMNKEAYSFLRGWVEEAFVEPLVELFESLDSTNFEGTKLALEKLRNEVEDFKRSSP